MRKISSLPNSEPDSTDYPLGRIKDESNLEAGTPVVEATYSDYIQSLGRFIIKSGITPNNLPENKTNGYQLVKAMEMCLSPLGQIIYWPLGSNFPIGFEECDGRSIDLTIGLNNKKYGDLKLLIENTYGGSGPVFNLPNISNKVIVSRSISHAIASTGGSETHTLTEAQLPSHNHDFAKSLYDNSNTLWDPNSIAGGNGVYKTYLNTTTSLKGGGQPHNNMQPYITMVAIMKTHYIANTLI